VERVATATGRSRRDVREVLDALLGELTGELAARQRITLSGFGSFEVRKRSARLARHPSTGDAIEVPDRDGVTFRASGRLLDSLRQTSSGG
jgi:nucleoid DNA-binding protein